MTPYELLPDYVLGLLTDAEKAQVEAALATDAHLQAELLAIKDAIGTLSLAVPQVEPPANLGAKIMAQAKPRPAKSSTVTLPRQQWYYYAAAAAALLVVIFGLVISMRSKPDPIAQVLNDENRATFAITGNDAVVGQFVVDSQYKQAVLQLENLDMLTTEQAYQVWIVNRADERISALVFQPAAAKTDVLLKLPEDFQKEFHTIGMTIEPAGGSPQPTGESVFILRLE